MAVPKRISLRVLFVLITSVCVALALFASWRRRAQIQEAAVEVLNSNGAKVKYEDERDILESVKVYWWSHYVSMRRSTRPSTAPDRDHWVSRTFGIDYLLAPASVSLGLWRERPTQETLDALANLPDLRYVGAHGSDLADDDLKYLRHHSQIEELRIAYTQVSGDGLGHLACLSNLVILSGPMPRQEDQFVSEQGLTAIAKCTNLQSLSFRVASDEDLNCLRNMSKLRHLNLVGSAINGHGLGYLPTPERLEGLDLADVDLNESVHAPLLKMVNLRAIRCSYSPIEDDTVAVLAKLKNLEMINLDNTLVTDNGLSLLRELPKLKALSVSATGVTSAGAAEFRKERPDVTLNANLLAN